MIKVYSHPRSGTHFVKEFIARNVYPSEDFSFGPVFYGHWSKIQKEDSSKNFKLFGSHSFPLKRHKYLPKKKVYIFRDGIDVAFSMWRSRWYHKDWGEITFDDYLTRKIDWYSSPTVCKESNQTILQHWLQHVEKWHSIQNRYIHIIRYEDLLLNPEKEYERLLSFKGIQPNTHFQKVENLVGLAPNTGKIHKYKDFISLQTEDIIYKSISIKCPYLWKN